MPLEAGFPETGLEFLGRLTDLMKPGKFTPLLRPLTSRGISERPKCQGLPPRVRCLPQARGGGQDQRGDWTLRRALRMRGPGSPASTRLRRPLAAAAGSAWKPWRGRWPPSLLEWPATEP